jgi:hypothetical protein
VKRRLQRILVSLVMGGAAAAHVGSPTPHRVPIRLADPSVCYANGPIRSVWEATDDPGFFHVHCASGVVVPAGGR